MLLSHPLSFFSLLYCFYSTFIIVGTCHIYIYIYILMYTSLLTPHFDEGFGMLPMSFERQKAMRNEELFLFDLIHQYCIWAMEK